MVLTIFTCTATNIPMLYMYLKIKFADIEVDNEHKIQSIKN